MSQSTPAILSTFVLFGMAKSINSKYYVLEWRTRPSHSIDWDSSWENSLVGWVSQSLFILMTFSSFLSPLRSAVGTPSSSLTNSLNWGSTLKGRSVCYNRINTSTSLTLWYRHEETSSFWDKSLSSSRKITSSSFLRPLKSVSRMPSLSLTHWSD